jgi:hypothetical protein
MGIWGPRSDRPAAARPGAKAADGDRPAFLFFARNAVPSRQGKKAGSSRCGKAIEAKGRPSGLISPFEAAQDACHEQTDRDQHGPGLSASQGLAPLGRTNTDSSVATAANRRCGAQRIDTWLSCAGLGRHLHHNQFDYSTNSTRTWKNGQRAR